MMPALDHLAAVITAVAVIFIVVAALIFGLRWWISATADLIWMVVLRPWLTLAICTPIAFVVIAGVYGLVAQTKDAFWALPLFAAVVVTPVPSRQLINHLARWRFSRANPTVAKNNSMKFVDVFALEELSLLVDYKPPETAKTTSVGSP